MFRSRLRMLSSLVILGGTSFEWPDADAECQLCFGGWDLSRVTDSLGSSRYHTYTAADSTSQQTATLSNPDDISRWGNDLFVGFQNGVGPQGQASTDGNLDSTVVEFTTSGHVIGPWDVAGKTDGLTADPEWA